MRSTLACVQRGKHLASGCKCGEHYFDGQWERLTGRLGIGQVEGRNWE